MQLIYTIMVGHVITFIWDQPEEAADQAFIYMDGDWREYLWSAEPLFICIYEQNVKKTYIWAYFVKGMDSFNSLLDMISQRNLPIFTGYIPNFKGQPECKAPSWFVKSTAAKQNRKCSYNLKRQNQFQFNGHYGRSYNGIIKLLGAKQDNHGLAWKRSWRSIISARTPAAVVSFPAPAPWITSGELS